MKIELFWALRAVRLWCWRFFSLFFFFLRSLSERKTTELKISHNCCEVKILTTLENVFNDGEWIKSMIILTSKYLLSTEHRHSHFCAQHHRSDFNLPSSNNNNNEKNETLPSLREREMENNFPKICQINNTRDISRPFIRASSITMQHPSPPPLASTF